MKNEGWGKEPFDLRLTILRALRCLPGILALTALGTLLLWGGYYLKNVVFNQEKTYSSSATFFIDYADENWYVNAKYFNDYTWNIWLGSDQLLDAVRKYLPEGEGDQGGAGVSFVAEVPADLRVVVIRAVTSDPQSANARMEALKNVLFNDFPEFVTEIKEVRMIDSKEAALDVLDLRLGRAACLALAVSLLFAICFFLIRELMLDKIWLPTSLTDRFGLKDLGIPGTPAYRENLDYLFRDKKTVAVCAARDDADPDAIVKSLQEASGDKEKKYFAVACPIEKPEGLQKLREADGILLAVKAGGASAEYVKKLISFLRQQDCDVTAATIWKPDAYLLRAYYLLGGKGKKK